jgi:hypothetical protein
MIDATLKRAGVAIPAASERRPRMRAEAGAFAPVSPASAADFLAAPTSSQGLADPALVHARSRRSGN